MSEEIVREDDEQEELEDEAEEVELEEQPDESDDTEDTDWKARALKAEALIVKQKKSEKKPKAEKPKTFNNPSDERLDRIELRQQGYNEDVIDQIIELGGPEALKNPVVKKAADDLQAQAKAEQGASIDVGSQQAPATKYTKKDLEGMSVEEMEKVLPHAEN